MKKILCILNNETTFSPSHTERELQLRDCVKIVADELKVRGYDVVMENWTYSRPDDHHPTSPGWGREEWSQVRGVVSCHPIAGVPKGISTASFDNDETQRKWADWL